jgi:SAM-dependent methyltransferase
VSDGNVAGNTFDKYASTNPIERRLMAGFLARLDRMLDVCAPRVVLEVGAGEGRITERLRRRYPEASVIGLDLLDEGLAGDWEQLDAPMLFGDATGLPIRSDSVDLVVALEVLEHVRAPASALNEIARVCRGSLIASVPREPIWRAGNMCRGRYVGELGNTPGHLNHWSTGAFRRFVDRTFEVAEVRTPLPWTMVRARCR